jgi:hypothetical protein
VAGWRVSLAGPVAESGSGHIIRGSVLVGLVDGVRSDQSQPVAGPRTYQPGRTSPAVIKHGDTDVTSYPTTDVVSAPLIIDFSDAAVIKTSDA